MNGWTIPIENVGMAPLASIPEIEGFKGEELRMEERFFRYRIDSRDVILSVSRNWAPFARVNGWNSELGPEKVIGHVLWDFIHGPETRHLYKEVFRKVRTGRLIGPIPFRCDSPQERRFLNLVLSPLPDGQIEITSAVARVERREAIKLLSTDIPRSNGPIKICSVCKKIATDRHHWLEIEEGLRKLKPFVDDEVPKLTHGLCHCCSQVIIAELNG